MTNFNYQGALDSGYSEEEVLNFLSEQKPSFDVNGALESGYSPQEVSKFLSDPEPEREKGLLEKGARIAGQFGTGVAEASTLAYDLAVAPLASKEAQTVSYKENIMDDIERLSIQKSTGRWEEDDQKLLDHLVKEFKEPTPENIVTADVSARGLAEKATGLDLQPEGFAEKTASMVGFLKDPKKLASVLKGGLTPKEVVKAILPSPVEISRGVGIEGGLEIAEDGGYGPIGKMVLMVLGDIVGGAAARGLKTGIEFLKDPKKAFGEIAAKFTAPEKKELQKEIIESFRKEGIQPDLGTITDNNLIKWTQSRLSQSGLVGKKLDTFKKDLFEDIRESYAKLASDLGEAKFSTNYEAGLVAKETIKNIQSQDLREVRKIYQSAEEALSSKAQVNTNKINQTIEKLEKKLKPGQLKSEQQKKVIDIIEVLKRDVADSAGNPISAEIKELMNNKAALNDMINYEVQGGTKQLLKELVGDIDRSIISHGKDNPRFAKEYIKANKRFSEHAKTFRNKEISKLLREEDPSKLMDRMNSVNNIKNLEKILTKTKEGKDLFQQLKRKKLEDLFNKSFISNSEKQLKLGTFSNALDATKSQEIAKEILGKRNFEKLKRIQKNAGVLNESAQKFYNASQSGVVATDVAIYSVALNNIFHFLSGNPWPFVKTAGAFATAKGMSNLMTDPEFLKIVEDIIIKGKGKNERKLFEEISKLKPYLKELTTSED